MSFLLRLAEKSLWNRKFVTALSILSIGLSVGLYLAVEKVREGARESFTNMISQTDLIVGARGGPIQLLLYSVFHIGNATNNISFSSYEKIKKDPAVAWTVPISLGDSHKGYRVVATTNDFFDHFRFRHDQSIQFKTGKPFSDLFDVVLGADVARKLHYKLGDHVVLSHGISEGASIYNHGDKPFVVSGILRATQTPIDRSLYITLEGMEAIHIDWQDGVPPGPGEGISAEKLRKQKIKISQITAFLLRAKSRIDVLRLERSISEFHDEPLTAIIPGVTLSELWQGIGYAEEALRSVSFLVILVGFLAMLISLYTTLNERRREMAILRAIGAKPFHIFFLLVLESSLLSIAGAFLGVFLVYTALFSFRPFIESEFGLFLPLHTLSPEEYIYLVAIMVVGSLLGFIPAMKAYRNALHDGLAAVM